MKYKPTLTTAALAKAEAVPAYRHPHSARTVALHLDGEAYTVTGLHCGPADKAAAKAAAKVSGDGTSEPKAAATKN